MREAVYEWAKIRPEPAKRLRSQIVLVTAWNRPA